LIGFERLFCILVLFILILDPGYLPKGKFRDDKEEEMALRKIESGVVVNLISQTLLIKLSLS
jgi:hypothetical protein